MILIYINIILYEYIEKHPVCDVSSAVMYIFVSKNSHDFELPQVDPLRRGAGPNQWDLSNCF